VSVFLSVVVTVTGLSCAEIGVAQSSARQMRVCSTQGGDREVDFFFIVWSRLKKDVFTQSALKMSRDFRRCHFFGTTGGRGLRVTDHELLIAISFSAVWVERAG
jgi:hypothetical protein